MQPAELNAELTVAHNDMMQLEVAAPGTVKRRRAVRFVSPKPVQLEMAVAELDGVKCFVSQLADGRLRVQLTKEEVYP